jgi:hypothetical protein
MLILKHRFDYFPSIERLVLSMPTKVYEQFSRSLTGRITEQLHLLSYRSGSLRILRRISEMSDLQQ